LKILIVTLAMTSVGQGRFYNRQDIGLARALARQGHTVSVYNFVKEPVPETTGHTENPRVYFLTSRAIGQHSLHAYSFITPDADAVICFSDNQLGFGRLLGRCERVGVPCLPYVGVLGSHSANPLKKAVVDLVISNDRYYKKRTVLAKTPQAAAGLTAAGAAEAVLAPVGLDEALLRRERTGDIRKLREQLGLPADGRVLLFLARMTPEKRPLAMADIFEKLHRKDSRCHLVAIGAGELSEAFCERLQKKHLAEAATCLKKVPNTDIWQYFCAADVMVNLNTEEIFGMAILEAMYYGCPVAARHAPGPDYIIEDGVDGLLCAEDDEVVEAVERVTEQECLHDTIARNARAKVHDCFLWDSTAKIISDRLAEIRAVKEHT
jgi:1,2-diacylglycerol 3-alpha-glucosyltransferase